MKSCPQYITLLPDDLLTLVLEHIEGHSTTSPHRVVAVHHIVPAVSKKWNQVWADTIVPRIRASPHCLHPELNVVDRMSCLAELDAIESDVRRMTSSYRDDLRFALRSERDNVPTLLSHVIVEIAFSLHSPRFPPRVPCLLRKYVRVIRRCAAKRILLHHLNRKHPFLPSWYKFDLCDPMHVAMKQFCSPEVAVVIFNALCPKV